MMEYGDSSVYFPFTFTQQDIDNVLFGYIRTPEETSNGFALSGVYVNSPANGKPFISIGYFFPPFRLAERPTENGW